jgi:carbamoyl-phosphate synthase large subunit
LVLGSGPIVIGQACEFDYSGTQACKALREEGYVVVLVNSNPATIMTDPETADRTYIEPLDPETVRGDRARTARRAVPTLGGQTGLNTADGPGRPGVLERFGVEMIGAGPRGRSTGPRGARSSGDAMAKIGLDLPQGRARPHLEEALRYRDDIGLPCVIRPGFTLGGSGGGIAYNRARVRGDLRRGLDLSMTSEILVEESVLGWKEFELEVMRDRRTTS